MNSANQTGTTSVSFTTDMSLVQTLLQDLQNEQTALVTADLDAIEQMVDRRMVLLQSLGDAAQKRYAALAATGFEASEKGMADWLEQQTNPELQQTWLTFQQQLIQAKELNRVNGLLIGKHFQRNQERLNALQNKSGAPQVYGKNGQAQAAAKYRSGLAV